MKIGILTQPIHLNYGGAIQNWALQQTLADMGHQPEMIWRVSYAPKPGIRAVAVRCASTAKTMALKCLGRGCRRRFDNPLSRGYSACAKYMDYGFVKRISRSRKCFDDVMLRRVVAGAGYDAFIVGSDQVWREEYSPRIETYFLDFLDEADPRPRVAYAASFGKEKEYIAAGKMPLCRSLLSRFDAVSVREDSGLKIVADDFGRADAVKVLDPTLLLDAERYRALIRRRERPEVPQLAAYILDSDPDKSRLVADVAGRLGLPVRESTANLGIEKMLTVGQWLAMFEGAGFVVTDSFHGMVFAIQFGRPFVVYANRYRGLDRFLSLLGELGLTDRLVYSYSEFEQRREALMTPIDYTAVRARIEELRSRSLAWLTNALRKL